jgi:hypothetical protein
MCLNFTGSVLIRVLHRFHDCRPDLYRYSARNVFFFILSPAELYLRYNAAPQWLEVGQSCFMYSVFHHLLYDYLLSGSASCEKEG